MPLSFSISQQKISFSDKGFKALQTQQSHQKNWKKSVFEVYQSAALPRDWTQELQFACHEVGLTSSRHLMRF